MSFIVPQTERFYIQSQDVHPLRTRSRFSEKGLPLRPLLIQYPMSALCTSQRRIRRQRKLCIAFTADVSHRLHLGLSVTASASAGAVAKGVLVVEGGDLVGFAGHFV